MQTDFLAAAEAVSMDRFLTNMEMVARGLPEDVEYLPPRDDYPHWSRAWQLDYDLRLWATGQAPAHVTCIPLPGHEQPIDHRARWKAQIIATTHFPMCEYYGDVG